jgi:hypothetical protein
MFPPLVPIPPTRTPSHRPTSRTPTIKIPNKIGSNYGFHKTLSKSKYLTATQLSLQQLYPQPIDLKGLNIADLRQFTDQHIDGQTLPLALNGVIANTQAPNNDNTTNLYTKIAA